MLRVRWTEEMFDIAGTPNVDLYGLAWSTIAVPEPSAVLMLAICLPAVLSLRRRG